MPIVASLIVAGAAILGSLLSSDDDEMEAYTGPTIEGVDELEATLSEFQYQPYETWMGLQDTVLAGIQAGLDAGGFSYDEATLETLRRQAMEDVAKSYETSAATAAAAFTPYGNIGAAARTAMGYASEQAAATATALEDISLSNAEAKLSSYSDLLTLASGLEDPTLEGQKLDAATSIANMEASNAMAQYNTTADLQTQMFNAQQLTPSYTRETSDVSEVGTALSTGLGTYISAESANTKNELLSSLLGGGDTNATADTIGSTISENPSWLWDTGG